MTTQIGIEESVSVTKASQLGISRLVANAEKGAECIVSRRGVPAAVVVGAARWADMLEREEDLRSAALVLARELSDTGERTTLDEVISALGFTRDELTVDHVLDTADHSPTP